MFFRPDWFERSFSFSTTRLTSFPRCPTTRSSRNPGWSFARLADQTGFMFRPIGSHLKKKRNSRLKGGWNIGLAKAAAFVRFSFIATNDLSLKHLVQLLLLSCRKKSVLLSESSLSASGGIRTHPLLNSGDSPEGCKSCQVLTTVKIIKLATPNFFAQAI